MQVRDISVKKRLFFANFMMVFIPVCLLALIGAAAFAGLRFTGAAQQRELSLLWPEKGPALSVQFAVSSLRVKAEKKGGPKLHEMMEDFQLLEAQGINTMILRDGQVSYMTPGADPVQLQAAVREKCGESQSMMLWDDDNFVFCYTSPRSGTTILAAGNVPFLAKGSIPEGNTRDVWEVVGFVALGLAIVFIIALGLYLSRLLSEQILEPLATLRSAASEIRRGNLDVPLQIQTQDELGDTCQAFDRMRRELKQAKETQERYEQNRKELIAGISHDLSTPLTSVKGYASGLLDGIAKTREKQQHYIEMIYQKACTMEKLVESLFLFSKLDLGRIPFHLEPVELYSYFADFAAERKGVLAERGLELVFLPEPGRAVVRLDRMQFQRVMENLIENSIKYKRQELVRVKLSLERQAGQVKLSFADDGIGVAQDELPRLFESFYRTDPARTNVAKGSGLGLAIVKQIIVGQQGRIWAEQTPGGGLTICMLLPTVEDGI